MQRYTVTLLVGSYKHLWFLPAVVAVLFCVSCDWGEGREQERKLKLLVLMGATKSQCIAVLGTNYVDHSIPSNRAALMQFLSREPTNRLVEIRQKVNTYSNSLFYSTPWIMTWVFFDEHDRIVDYALSAQ
jgi:hypothetical protein